MTVENLSQYNEKKVVLTYNLSEPNADGHSTVEVEGTAVMANEMAVLFRPKGKSQTELIEADKIEAVVFAPEKAKKLAPKYLKEIEFGQARTHLVERHGYKISDIEKMSEADALEFHGQLDHGDLGHRHGEKPAKAAAETATEGENEDD